MPYEPLQRVARQVESLLAHGATELIVRRVMDGYIISDESSIDGAFVHVANGVDDHNRVLIDSKEDVP